MGFLETLTSQEQPSNQSHLDSVLWVLFRKVDWSKSLHLFTYWNSSCAITQEQASSLVTSVQERSILDGMISMKKKNCRSVLLNCTTDVLLCSESLGSWSMNN